MERLVTLRIPLTDEELAQIVPSGSVDVEIHSTRGYVDVTGEIVRVESVKD